ncbi:hypothetical protein AEB_P1414 [Altererythrobacter sp. B11]|nr:hypothetical protein AEB_P1414 [Altererythrobacter sp. B11]
MASRYPLRPAPFAAPRGTRLRGLAMPALILAWGLAAVTIAALLR